MTEHVHRFHCMGCEMAVVVEGDGGAANRATRAAEAQLHELDARWSRFRPNSELCRLNADPRALVPASDALRAVIGAGLWAAERTGGLVDPTLLAAIEAAGYARSRDGLTPASLTDALRVAPPRRSAGPHPDAAWKRVTVEAAAIRRPPGVRFDTGGTGKGLAADLVARRLAGHARFAVDCGGDLRIGGDEAAARPYAVDVLHPLGGVAHTVPVGAGAIATSGIDTRIWRGPDGRFAHHLLDPATGAPAWTGLVSVTALAPTALEAETLAKAALLSGPRRAKRLLARHGGVLVRDDGDVEPVGSLRPRPVVSLPVQGRAA